MIRDEPFDEDALKDEFGVDSFVGGINGFEARKALAAAPRAISPGSYLAMLETVQRQSFQTMRLQRSTFG